MVAVVLATSLALGGALLALLAALAFADHALTGSTPLSLGVGASLAAALALAGALLLGLAARR